MIAQPFVISQLCEAILHPLEHSTPARCVECRRLVWFVASSSAIVEHHGHVPLCVYCANECLRGGDVNLESSMQEQRAKNARDHCYDPNLMHLQEEHREVELDLLEAKSRLTLWTSANSPRWVNCRACGAYRGDQCHTGRGYCEGRVKANRGRLKELETWAISWESPCHATRCWLAWRSTDDLQTWTGVPCFARGCGATYAVERYESDLVDERVRVDRINPHLVEMRCWATEEEDPWQ